MAKVKDIEIVRDTDERFPFITEYKGRYRVNMLPYEGTLDNPIPKLGKVTGIYVTLFYLAGKTKLTDFTVVDGYITDAINKNDLVEIKDRKMKITTE